ncbi:glucose-1-phosphate adenylyltransferase [Pedobacter sp. BS3]|uniref:glucose-1-phosphate adenylyltransferase n=1 Tax=Pedobacter sp. BS3 TaxID=2567937 RepID=UPI0011F0694C|nr:glucose-1-phosphate adenylyltransferase [Pedobacter sp. BS3]TZF83056.1 glucose-1-phosphate adenylyltransferase [Pedobacter sp. BS3]
MTSKVISVILGGGQGTRLYPLTATRSKPAVSIAGKYRLVDIPISNCLNSGIDRIFVLTQFNSASLNKHIKNTYHFSIFGSAFVDILAAEQTPQSTNWFQGTADAVRRSLHHLAPFDFEYVLILSGDQLYQMDFTDMMNFHEQNKADVSVATIPVTARDVPGFGIMKSDENHIITAFVEKPKSGFEYLASEVNEELQAQGRIYQASMGIYIFNRDVLYDMLTNDPHTDFGKEIIPSAINTHKVISYQYDGYWTDIGTIPSFYEANIGLTDDIPSFNLFDKHTIFSRARMLPPSKISGTIVDKALIADGCIINASRVERSVIGIRTRIGKESTIIASYVMGSDYYQTLEQLQQAQHDNVPIIGVGERCYIENALLDKNCAIGNDVTIKGGPHLANGDYEKYVVQDGIVVVKKMAVIPNGFTI